MHKIRIALTVLLAITVLAVTAWSGPPNVRFTDVGALGMGGAGICTQDNFNALYYNPAMLVRSGFHLDIINFQMRMSKDISDMADIYSDNQEHFDNYTDEDLVTDAERLDLYNKLAKYDDNWIGFGAYPQIGITFSHFAIGAYASVDLDFKTDLGVMVEPRVYLYGIGDQVFTGGLAFKMPEFLPNDLYGGAALKIIKRYEVYEKMNASDVEMEDAYDTLIEDSKSGYGIDLGFLYELKPGKADIGVKITDLVASIDGDKPSMVVNVGAAYWLTENFVFAADYNDLFFADGENIFN